jgi:hypothetical protein
MFTQGVVMSEINSLDELNSMESGGKSSSFNSNAYFGIRYVDNEEVFITFLTDLKRSLKINRHYDKPNKQFRTCNKTYTGKNGDCEDCESSNKELKRTSPTRYFLVYNHNVAANPVGKKENGEEFHKNPLQIYAAKQGEGGENFMAIEDNNGEDPSYYYDNPKNLALANPELLKENALFFNESGQDKVWKIKRNGGKKADGTTEKTSYPPIALAEHREVRKALNLDKDALIKVPTEIRDAVNKLTLTDLAGHYLTQVNDVKWEPFNKLGVFAPTEGSRVGDLPKEEAKKGDREAAGAKL